MHDMFLASLPCPGESVILFHCQSVLFSITLPVPSAALYDRLAKKAKKERQGKGKGGDAAGKGSAGAKSNSGPKPKMTKEERRAKYTQK